MLIAHHFNGLKDDPALDRLRDPNPPSFNSLKEVKNEESDFDRAMTSVSNHKKPSLEYVSYNEPALINDRAKDVSLSKEDPSLKEDVNIDKKKNSSVNDDNQHTMEELKQEINQILKKVKGNQINIKEIKSELNQLMGQLQSLVTHLEGALQNGAVLKASVNGQEGSLNLKNLKGNLAQLQNLVENMNSSKPAALITEDLNSIQKGLKDLLSNVPNDLKQLMGEKIDFSKLNDKNQQLTVKAETTAAENQNQTVLQQDTNNLQKKVEYTQDVRQAQAQRNQLEMNMGTQNPSTANSQAQNALGLKVNGAQGNKGGSLSGGQNNHFGQQAPMSNGLEGIMQRMNADPTTSFTMTPTERLNLGREVLNQLGDSLKGNIGKTQSKFSFTLNPQELGKVTVHLDMKEEVIKGQIVVENEIVKDLLKDRFKEMSTLFEAQGIQLEGLDVQTQSEFDKQNSQSQYDKQADLFNQHKDASNQVKLNRELNLEKPSTQYEKMIDNIYNSGEFLITI